MTEADGTKLDTIVVGAGAWGTALAIMLHGPDSPTALVARSEEKAGSINDLHENADYLPEIRLPESLIAYSLERDDAMRRVFARSPNAVIVLAAPAQATRATLGQIQPYLQADQTLILTAKGLERDTGKRLTEVAGEEVPRRTLAVLSGPSFAHDVARGLPTAVTLASQSITETEQIAARIQRPMFRPYVSDDIIGVQLGGALKNVLAIAAGVIAGKGLGESAKAALISRGFAELSRLSIALGARPETLSGLSGLGDLVLTCSTAGSRNFHFGERLGQGETVSRLMESKQPLAEGAKTATAALALGYDHGVDLPITAAVAAIVEGECTVDDVIAQLMARPLKRESETRI
ncbi:MAG: NAD(P)H-dependent glycerol-3-phosphate dehydrogenase [Pseudomonadota bacterium]